MRTYLISNYPQNSAEIIWDKISLAAIDLFPWGGDFRPQCTAKLVATTSALCGQLTANETDLRCAVNEDNGTVYEDSCLEFFFNPTPEKSQNYFNFEFNPLGVLHLGFAEGRNNRVHPIIKNSDYRAFFAINTVVEKSRDWRVNFAIPYDFIREYFPAFTTPTAKQIMRGNFYKCGDKTAQPHYAVWNNIETPQPDYHRPEFFGKLIFA